jgi:hypothetical protein
VSDGELPSCHVQCTHNRDSTKCLEVIPVTIIRITKKQIEEANKARDAALKEDQDFRLHEEQRQRLTREADAARVMEHQP